MTIGRSIAVSPSASHSCQVNGLVHAQPDELVASALVTIPMLPLKYGCAHTTPFSCLSDVTVTLAINASQSPSSGTTRSYSVGDVPVSTQANW